METIKNMYFSKTIKAMHHNRIRKQLESGNKKMKKDLHPIIMRKTGDNLFQFIELNDYYDLFEVSDAYILIGAVKSYEEFGEFVELIVNECLGKNIPIEKGAILEYLRERI